MKNIAWYDWILIGGVIIFVIAMIILFVRLWRNTADGDITGSYIDYDDYLSTPETDEDSAAQAAMTAANIAANM